MWGQEGGEWDCLDTSPQGGKCTLSNTWKGKVNLNFC